MNKETWIDVIGYEGLYLVSSIGEVKSLPKKRGSFIMKNEKILSQKTTKHGYLGVMLSKNDVRKTFASHRLVAINFIPNPNKKPCVNHINGIKNDNRVENLEWVDYYENMKHAVNTGLLSVRGENNSACKITKEAALDIFTSNSTVKQLAEKYNVSTNLISKIRGKKVWLSVTEKLQKHDRRIRQVR